MKFAPLLSDAPYFLHGGDYNPDQWQQYPEVIDEDFRLMKLSGCNTFSIGIFSWTSYEPQEGNYQFGWLDQIMDRLAQNGYHAILATPSGAMPAWMAQKYPEIRRVNRQGQRANYSTRENHCWTSPVYREKVTAINTRLAERYQKHPALAGWHISNEYNGECCCENCLASFRSWLQRKYQTIDRLNAAWWSGFWSHTYTDWSEINPDDCCVDGLTLDWRRFITWLTCDFMKHEIAPLRQITPKIPVATNIMGYYDCLDYWRIADVCDFVADDCYPNWDDAKHYDEEAARYALLHDMHRSMKNGKPFLMMESTPSTLNWKEYYRLKRPGVHQLEMMLAMGHGADGTMYFQWRKGQGGWEKFHGAVVDHVGHENNRVFKDIANIGTIHSKIQDVVGTSIDVQTAVIHDWECRWALDVCGGPTKNNKKMVETIQAHYLALFRLNVPMDVIESTSDFSKYKLLVAPMLFMLKPGVAERLKDFVKQGGTLIFTYLGGYINETNLCFRGGLPGDGLRELFGIWNEELDGFTPQDQQGLKLKAGNELSLDGQYEVVEFAERIHLEGATALAHFSHDFYAGEPALTVNRCGQGKAYYMAARTNDDFLLDFYRAIVKANAIKTTLPPDVPAKVHGTIRTDGKKQYLFIFNWDQQEVTVRLDQQAKDQLTGQSIANTLVLPGYGSTVLELL